MARPDPTVVTPAVLRDWPLPDPSGGKGTRGQVVVVGGTRSTPGGVLLAGEASLRAGAGKLAMATVESLGAALAVAVPESSVTGVAETEDGDIAATAAEEIRTLAEGADAVVVGSGFGDPVASTRLVEALVPSIDVPLVVDALASAYLTEHPDGLHHLEGRVVLCVNPTELARTARMEQDEVEADPAAAAVAVAQRSRVVVLCGGTSKQVVAPDGRTWVIEGGGSGLGVSGSGDAQAGIVGGLLARGAEPAQAAVWGGYLHARAGERLAAAVGKVGFLARELPGEVPAILSELA